MRLFFMTVVFAGLLSSSGFAQVRGGGQKSQLKTDDSGPDQELIIAGVYPNPVDKGTQVSFEARENSMTDIYIFDLTGRLVFEEHFRNEENGPVHHSLDLENLGKGMYFVQVNNGGSVSTTRIEKL